MLPNHSVRKSITLYSPEHILGHYIKAPPTLLAPYPAGSKLLCQDSFAPFYRPYGAWLPDFLAQIMFSHLFFHVQVCGGMGDVLNY